MANINGGDAADLLEGGSFEDSLGGAGGNDTLKGYGGNDTLDGDSGDDTLEGGGGNDTLYGGDGNDWLLADGDAIGFFNLLDGGAGNDLLRGSAAGDTLLGGHGDDVLHAGGGNDLLQGGAGNDRLSTDQPGRFKLEGGDGNDTFSALNLGFSSVVELRGGTGRDTFIADFETPDAGGSDSLVRCLDFKAGAGGDVIDLSRLVPLIPGLVGIDDPFDPRLGYLRLVQQGQDTALQFDADGLAGDASGWHTMLLMKAVTASKLTAADNFSGAASVKTLSVVQGAGAAPTLAAPIPDLPALAGESIRYQVPQGSFADADVGDAMQLGATLASGAALPGWMVFDVRSQTFTGTLPSDGPQLPLQIRVTATDAAGGSVSDVFSITPATTGNDALTGSAGNDAYDGLDGDDTIDGAGGNDSLDGGLGSDRLLGGDGNDSLGGGDGPDALDGGAGVDTMAGGAGNDSYTVDQAADKVVEAAGGGTADSVTTLVNYTLAAEVETLVLGSHGNLVGTGNAQANKLVGNAGHNSLSGADGHDRLGGGSGNDTLAGGNGNDSLDGGDGIDSMIGGAGDDSYVVQVAADRVVEAAGGGTGDQVTAWVSYTVGAEIEHLVLGGSADLSGVGDAMANRITGNTGHNRLTGGGGNDTLDGGAGNDTMDGGTGDDTYVLSVHTDQIVETTGGGTADRVDSWVTHTLGPELEHLQLLGTSNLGGTGNAVANRITGNAANNIVNGLDGNDTLAGGAGNDTLRGGNGTDSLDGGTGIDSMDGGAGNDRYVVDAAADKVTEQAGGGTADQVTALLSWTLGAELERLVIGGSEALNGTGNALANQLTGNKGKNVLNGAGGNDTMTGGDGNDTYYAGSSGDVVIETNANAKTGGIDTVISSLAAYTLGSHVENGRINTTGPASLTGNELDNRLLAGAGDNVLQGGAGNDTADYATAGGAVTVSLAVTTAQATGGSGKDTLSFIENLAGSPFADRLTGNSGNNVLSGGAGNDSLSGGAGNDSFRFSSAPGSGNVDRVADWVAGSDTLQFENGVFTALPRTGLLASGHFRADASGLATDSDDFILYETDRGHLFYDADGSGAGARVLVAILEGLPALSHADIFVT
jgi:Ca2+-binding RTX toxin-like protein